MQLDDKSSTQLKPVRIGDFGWSREDFLSELKDFHAAYLERPIKDNHGGMSSSHLFLLWFLLRKLRPTTVIESGVFQGQGTWLIEKALPTAQLNCIDIDWSKLKYKSTRATYFSQDFATIDWGTLDKSKTFVFFDDHMNAFQRTLDCARLGFKHIAFEDNYYPANVGDVYSVKLALAGLGYQPTRDIRYWLNRLRGIRHDVAVRPNTDDAAKLKQVIEVYREMPPIFLPAMSRWGYAYTTLPTEAPILTEIEADWQRIFQEEAKWYTWLAYLRLK